MEATGKASVAETGGTTLPHPDPQQERCRATINCAVGSGYQGGKSFASAATCGGQGGGDLSDGS
jgi:hypothetical protein